MPTFKVFILHTGQRDSSPFFPLKKHAAIQLKQNLCSNFNTFIGFPHFCFINIIQFHFRWNIIRFFLRKKEIRKTLNPSRIFDIIFWSAFLSSLYFKHSFTNNPFLESLDSLANSACRIQLLNGDVLIVLCLLMVVDMTDNISDRFV